MYYCQLNCTHVACAAFAKLPALFITTEFGAGSYCHFTKPRNLPTRSPQLLVLFLFFDQNWNIRIGVFPERKKILIGLAAFIARKSSGASQSLMRQRKERRCIKLPSAVKYCHPFYCGRPTRRIKS